MAYPRQLTVEKILDTAIKMLKSAPEVGLRPLAREMGVQAPSLYRYYDSKKALAKAMAEEGYRRLGGELDKALRKEASLVSMARAYRRFASDHPRLYHLMHQDHLEPHHNSPAAEAAIAPLAGYLGLDRNDSRFVDTFRVMRAFVHGFVSLENSGLFTDKGPPERAFEQGLEMLASLQGDRKPEKHRA